MIKFKIKFAFTPLNAFDSSGNPNNLQLPLLLSHSLTECLHQFNAQPIY